GRADARSPAPRGPYAAYQLAIAVYGGYFGAGIGIVMLAGLGVVGFTDIHLMLALRDVAAVWGNAVAAAWFVARGAISRRRAGVMPVGQIVGNYVGARLARALRPELVRRAVVAIGVAIGLWLLLVGRH